MKISKILLTLLTWVTSDSNLANVGQRFRATTEISQSQMGFNTITLILNDSRRGNSSLTPTLWFYQDRHTSTQTPNPHTQCEVLPILLSYHQVCAFNPFPRNTPAPCRIASDLIKDIWSPSNPCSTAGPATLYRHSRPWPGYSFVKPSWLITPSLSLAARLPAAASCFRQAL